MQQARALRPAADRRVAALAVPMSKPTGSATSTPSAPTVLSTPAFGGSWSTRAARALSIPKSWVVVAPAKLFV